MSVKTKAQKLLKSPKKQDLNELKQNYLNTKNHFAKQMLLKLIQRQDPKFKG